VNLSTFSFFRHIQQAALLYYFYVQYTCPSFFLYTISTLQKKCGLMKAHPSSDLLLTFTSVPCPFIMSAVQIRVRRIRNFFYSFRSKSKQVWILFASYSHGFGILASFASNWRIFASKYLFRSKYSQNFKLI
jgi:hypothetical protein